MTKSGDDFVTKSGYKDFEDGFSGSDLA